MESAAIRPARQLLLRIQGEFLEMPGLCLTEPQARRLWGLDPRHCAAVLSALIEDGFLRRTGDGSVMRSAAVTALDARVPQARAVPA